MIGEYQKLNKNSKVANFVIDLYMVRYGVKIHYNYEFLKPMKLRLFIIAVALLFINFP